MAAALALVLHAHQPVGNFDHVIEESYQRAYLPFLTSAAHHPRLRFTLHYSGFLLDWLAQRHPEYLEMLRGLEAAERVEILGGGYYEPILAAIPAAHQRLQLDRLAAAVERHFGRRPRGAWLAERVWEPGLASVLASAGIEYTLLDDTHLRLADVPEGDLHGHWRTEDQGRTLDVFPSNFFLRQAIPFQPVEASFDYLRGHGGRVVTMGDDLEKFGSWPGTHAHCYDQGWLERFWQGLAEFETLTLAQARGCQRPGGLVYLPTASYPEMMQWAGSANWRAFFAKYPESNLIHKTLEEVHERCSAMPPGRDADAAREHLLAAEANDVYWHGWFGGLYSPHLRNVAFTHLLAADALADEAAPVGPVRRFDLHRDGTERIELRSAALRILIAPERDGELEELDVLARNANVLNLIRRRPEPYHKDLLAHAAANPAHLPGGVATPAADLASYLNYDPEAAEIWSVVTAEPDRVVLACGDRRKTFSLAGDTLAVEVQGGAPSVTWRFALPAIGAGRLPPGPLTLADGWRNFRLALEAPGADHWEAEPLYTVSQAEHGFEAIYQGSRLRAAWPAGTRSMVSRVKILLD